MIRVAINGFGRIGRNAFKIASTKKNIQIVVINDLTDNTTLAHLLRHDSNYGQYNKAVKSDDKYLYVDGKRILVTAIPEVEKLPWKENKIDVVIESTGRFTTHEDLQKHIKAGSKSVVLSAPEKGENKDTFVIGANDSRLSNTNQIISNASCTTNCIAPIMAILSESIGIEKSLMTTVHSYTQSQQLQDGPGKDLREARAAAENIVPTTTGAATAAALTIPELKDKFDGLSIRVPTPVVSLSDITFVAKKNTTIEEINSVLQKASHSTHKGIISYTDEELVSSDFIGDPHSCIVDLKLTNVVDGNLCKVVAWYDNEWGYSNRLVEMVQLVGENLRKKA
ncbi:MAG: hypothetical protein QG675_305 [Patescibacteria group bacterium]|jgi:glyceraldehyde 3-phosphate dehydrogenase|nr:hypothetical protein [Patescibacteria group bacterium]